MLETLRKETLPATLLKHFILVSLFFPYYNHLYAPTVYSPNFVLAHVFVIAYLGVMIIQKRLEWNWKWSLPGFLTVLLLGFNIGQTYLNATASTPWFWGQINISAVVLFFVGLICAKGQDISPKEDLIPFLLKAIAISNLIALIPYLFNMTSLTLHGANFEFNPETYEFGERRYSWFFVHKCEYALMLLMELSLVLMYRNRYRKKWQLWGTVGLLMLCLVITHTMASIFASLFIFAGLFLDMLRKASPVVRRRFILAFIPLAIIGVIVVIIMIRTRDLLTLGSRLFLWLGGLERILSRPRGAGIDAGAVMYDLGPHTVNSPHNMFLITLYHYSIPTGLLLDLMAFAIIISSLRRRRSWLATLSWFAMFIALCMDWCLLLSNAAFFLLGIYFLYFAPLNSPSGEPKMIE